MLKLTVPFKKIVGPVRDASGSIVYLYEVPGQNPFAWVAGGAVRGDDQQALATVINDRFDPTRAAIVDTQSTIAATDLSKISSAAATPRVTKYEAGHVEIDLSGTVAEGNVLVASENFYPGWTATVDGKPAPTSRANFNLIGVGLPAGARHVSLTYDDPAYHTGKLLSIVAILLSVGALVAGWIFDRRRFALAPA
jgi:hypothetical protein